MAGDTMLRGSAPGQRDDVRERPQLSTFHKAKLAFLAASFASLVFSVVLWATGNQTQALFVGLWVPSIHSLGALVLTGEQPADEEGTTR